MGLCALLFAVLWRQLHRPEAPVQNPALVFPSPFPRSRADLMAVSNAEADLN